MGYANRTIEYNGLTLEVSYEYDEYQPETFEQEGIEEGFCCFESITCKGIDMLFLADLDEDNLIELLNPER